MRASKWVLTGLFIAALSAANAWAADGSGLNLSGDKLPWLRWQGRLTVEVQTPLLRSGLGESQATGLQVRSVSLMRDVYLTRSLLGAGIEGGLHTTGGLIVSPGSRTAGQALFGAQPGFNSLARRSDGASLLGAETGAEGSATVPYLGVGYTGLSAKGGWSFSADLGLVALAAGNAVKFGRVFSGTQTLDGLAREMRVAPIMQMGLSYSF
jgi:hypothetical protein